jgi:hypothetical protein
LVGVLKRVDVKKETPTREKLEEFFYGLYCEESIFTLPSKGTSFQFQGESEVPNQRASKRIRVTTLKW